MRHCQNHTAHLLFGIMLFAACGGETSDQARTDIATSNDGERENRFVEPEPNAVGLPAPVKKQSERVSNTHHESHAQIPGFWRCFRAPRPRKGRTIRAGRRGHLVQRLRTGVEPETSMGIFLNLDDEPELELIESVVSCDTGLSYGCRLLYRADEPNGLG